MPAPARPTRPDRTPGILLVAGVGSSCCCVYAFGEGVCLVSFVFVLVGTLLSLISEKRTGIGKRLDLLVL